MSAAALAIQLLNGLASASSLFLVAAGLTLIFGVSRIVNFAHGSLYMSVHSRCSGPKAASLATIAPSSTSEWPPMYFVAACTDTSTPWSNARK